mmetsp:Transcript_101085/g.326260  ORF Transcript_101085/g.326260 Transcript_101085/m.326260 type:complete len:90 (+) Transcript_101085:130-399(+)
MPMHFAKSRALHNGITHGPCSDDSQVLVEPTLGAPHCSVVDWCRERRPDVGTLTGARQQMDTSSTHFKQHAATKRLSGSSTGLGLSLQS